MVIDLSAPTRWRERGRDPGMASTLPVDIGKGLEAGRCRWRPGDRVGRYELSWEIGAGAMGVVWCARDRDLDRDVALKLIRSGGSSLPLLRAQLLREARALARSPHPNVVAIHDVGASDGNLFIAMEHMEGHTLGDWLRSAPRPWTEVVEKFIAAGRGLAEAHRAGLVHRDFKPENVLLDRDGIAKVGDFGLAIPVGDGGATDTPERGDGETVVAPDGDLVGTLAFMAPEQLAGDRATARSDQFSFCVALYEALYGVRPYGAPSGEAHAAILLAAIMDGKLTPRPAGPVPARMHRLLLRGLAYDPDDRWPNMDDLLAQLERCSRRGGRRSWVTAAGGRVVAAMSAALRGLRRSWATPVTRALCAGNMASSAGI